LMLCEGFMSAYQVNRTVRLLRGDEPLSVVEVVCEAFLLEIQPVVLFAWLCRCRLGGDIVTIPEEELGPWFVAGCIATVLLIPLVWTDWFETDKAWLRRRCVPAHSLPDAVRQCVERRDHGGASGHVLRLCEVGRQARDTNLVYAVARVSFWITERPHHIECINFALCAYLFREFWSSVDRPSVVRIEHAVPQAVVYLVMEWGWCTVLWVLSSLVFTAVQRRLGRAVERTFGWKLRRRRILLCAMSISYIAVAVSSFQEYDAMVPAVVDAAVAAFVVVPLMFGVCVVCLFLMHATTSMVPFIAQASEKGMR